MQAAGSGSLSASICDDPAAMAEQLAELYHSGITAAPKHVLSAGQLARAVESEEDAAKLLEELRGLVGELAKHLAPTAARCRTLSRHAPADCLQLEGRMDQPLPWALALLDV